MAIGTGTRRRHRRAVLVGIATGAMMVAGLPLAASASAATKPCSASDLIARFKSGGSPDQANLVIFRNGSQKTCSVVGSPTLSRWDLNGGGAWSFGRKLKTTTLKGAIETPYSYSADAGKPIVLKPGAKASFLWQPMLMDGSTCDGTTRVLGITLPNGGGRMTFGVKYPECGPQIMVSILAPGTAGGRVT